MMGLAKEGPAGGHFPGPPPVSAAASPHVTHPAFPMSMPMWFQPTQTAYSLFLGGEKALAASQYLAAADPFAKAAASNPFFDLARMGHYPLGKKLFGCPQCRYITDRKNNLKRHVATMHQECDKALECCGVVFKNKASLRDHVLIFHSNGYMCRFCGRNFCRKALLKRHLTVHSGQKDYLCSQCDYATSHKSNLERHKKVHERQTTDSEDNDMDNPSPNKDDSSPSMCTSTTSSFSVAALFSPAHHPAHLPTSGAHSHHAEITSGLTHDLRLDHHNRHSQRDFSTPPPLRRESSSSGGGGSTSSSGVRRTVAHSTTSEHPLHHHHHHHQNHRHHHQPIPRLSTPPGVDHDDDNLTLSPIDVDEDPNTLINVVDLAN